MPRLPKTQLGSLMSDDDNGQHVYYSVCAECGERVRDLFTHFELDHPVDLEYVPPPPSDLLRRNNYWPTEWPEAEWPETEWPEEQWPGEQILEEQIQLSENQEELHFQEKEEELKFEEAA